MSRQAARAVGYMRAAHPSGVAEERKFVWVSTASS